MLFWFLFLIPISNVLKKKGRKVTKRRAVFCIHVEHTLFIWRSAKETKRNNKTKLVCVSSNERRMQTSHTKSERKKYIAHSRRNQQIPLMCDTIECKFSPLSIASINEHKFIGQAYYLLWFVCNWEPTKSSLRNCTRTCIESRTLFSQNFFSMCLLNSQKKYSIKSKRYNFFCMLWISSIDIRYLWVFRLCAFCCEYQRHVSFSSFIDFSYSSIQPYSCMANSIQYIFHSHRLTLASFSFVLFMSFDCKCSY